MTRGVGVTEAVTGTLPPEAVALLAILTHLGDPAMLVAIGAVAYWRWDRARGVVLLSLAIGALALVVTLKALFGLPRPPVALHAVPADGFGFPSGHAVGAAAVIGGLAVYTDVGPRRHRVLLAGGLIAIVAVSRVGLGVHYAVDVVVGVAVGLGFLGLHRWSLTSDGTRGFSLAVLVGLTGVLAAGPTRDALALIGLAVGGVLALTYIPRPPGPHRRRDLPTMVIGLPIAGGLGLAASGPWAPTVVVPVAGAALTVVILGLPTITGWVDGAAPAG
ncbi:MAG: phosphatase PAP2 family protein [Halobacteriales archaeon]|nr:phosphatase PAP2 family protein [Halobacteriales archaeon]